MHIPTWIARLAIAACLSLPTLTMAQTGTAPPNKSAASDGQSGISIYSYVDDAGVVHFVDSLDLVPEAYRVQAAERAKAGAMVGDGQGTFNVVPVPAFPETLGESETEDVGDEGSAADATTGPAPRAEADKPSGTEGPSPATEPKLQGKAYWQARIAQWQQRKAAAEAELEVVDAQILRTRTLTPPGFHQTLAELMERRKALEETIRHAEDMLTNVIPEEARKAGVPPGWLR